MSDNTKRGSTFVAVTKFWLGMAQAGAESVEHFFEERPLTGSGSRARLAERSAAAFSRFFNQAQTVARDTHDTLKSGPRRPAPKKSNGVRIID